MSDDQRSSVEQLDENALRIKLQEILENGLETEVEPRSYSHEEIMDVVTRLQRLDEHDYNNKLAISGFTLDPYISNDMEQACDTCMYYRVHQKFCELPELMLPVEPKWSCRLWRI